MWKKIADESKYINAHKYFADYINRYKDNGRIDIPCNFIFHPNMDFDMYFEKLEYIKNISSMKNWTNPQFILVPHMHTKINSDHKWYFLPEYIWWQFLWSDFYDRVSEPSYWWYFYLNSCFLDWYVISKVLSVWWLFESMLTYLKNQDFSDDEKKLIFLPRFLQLLLKKFKRDFWKFGSISFMLKHPIYFKRNYKSNKIQFWIAVKFVVDYISYIIFRENYIRHNNPNYSNEMLDDFLWFLESIKQDFLNLRI